MGRASSLGWVPSPKGGISLEDRCELKRSADIEVMKINRSLIRAFLMSILAGLVLVSAGMASAGHLGFLRASDKATVRLDSTTCDPDGDEATAPGDEAASPGDEATSPDEEAPPEGNEPKECEEPDEGDGTTNSGAVDEVTAQADPAAREAECNEAAGISATEAGSDAPSDVKKTGLDHAIEVVLANCIKNPQAPGLVNALRHLVANRDRHMAHEAEKAARRAAREAAKAARIAAHGSHGKGA